MPCLPPTRLSCKVPTHHSFHEQDAVDRARLAEQRARQAEQRASDAESRAARLLALEDQLTMQKRLGDAVCKCHNRGRGSGLYMTWHWAFLQARADADRVEQDNRRVWRLLQLPLDPQWWCS